MSECLDDASPQGTHSSGARDKVLRFNCDANKVQRAAGTRELSARACGQAVRGVCSSAGAGRQQYVSKVNTVKVTSGCMRHRC